MKKIFTSIPILIFICFCLGTLSVSAQSGSIKGKVLDEKSKPVSYATVLLKGTSYGANTDDDGMYEIDKLPAGTYTISVSDVGYADFNQSVTVGSSPVTVDVQLKTDYLALSEVVVVGYGTQQKREITGSLAKVDGGDLTPIPATSFTAGLQGKSAGLQVVGQSAIAGAPVRVRIRGQNSISGKGSPLYVIDGVPMNNEDYTSKNYSTISAVSLDPLSTINQDDIESITVLKDAAATAIYGARGANGVILITTKRGKAGNTQFNVDYNVGFSNPAKKVDYLTGPEWGKLYVQAGKNDSAVNPAYDPFRYDPTLNDLDSSVTINGIKYYEHQLANMTTNTDWIDQMLRTGVSNNLSVSASGGNEKTKFYFSGTYDDNQTIFQGNRFQLMGGRVNVDNQASDKVAVGLSTGNYYTINDQVSTSYNGGFGAAQSNALPIFPIYNDDGTFFGQQSTQNGTGNNQITYNPVAGLENKYTTSVYHNTSDVYFAYDPIKNLEFRPDFGVDYYSQLENYYYSDVNRYYNAIGLAAMEQRRAFAVNLNGNATLTYKFNIEENHHFNVVAGSSMLINNTKAIGFAPVGAVGFLDNYYQDVSSNMTFAPWASATVKAGPAINGYNSWDYYRFLSFFARANYNYKEKYYVQASLRADGSSRFGPNNRYGYFPAVSLGWVMSDEEFMKNMEWWSYMKVKGSFGYTGNSDIGNFGWIGLGSPAGGYLGSAGLAQNVLPNPDLSWEQLRQVDIGFEYGFLGDRISGSFDYYNNQSSKVLLKQQVQISYTGLQEFYINSPIKISNTGVEFSIKTENLVGKLSWTTEFNISHNTNTVSDIPTNLAPDALGFGIGDTRLFDGHPIGTSFLAVSQGVNPATGWEQIVDSTGALVDLQGYGLTPGTVQQNNRVPVGNPFPDFIAGMTNTLTYDGFDLSFDLYTSVGNTIYDDGAKYQYGARLATWNQLAVVENYWTGDGDQTDITKLTLRPYNPDNDNTTRWLFKATYLRMRSITLGYRLPKHWMDKAKLTQVRIYVSATNLFTITKYPGWDPEVTRYADGNVTSNQYGQDNTTFTAPYLASPQARTISLGLNLGF